VRGGRPQDDGLRARAFIWPPLRLARMRCERGSVVAVLPASSRRTEITQGGPGMRIIGFDIHRVFAEAVMLEDGKIKRLGRIGMTRDHLAVFAGH
jgi:transposase